MLTILVQEIRGKRVQIPDLIGSCKFQECLWGDAWGTVEGRAGTGRYTDEIGSAVVVPHWWTRNLDGEKGRRHVER
jgi:hypothetical protein